MKTIIKGTIILTALAIILGCATTQESEPEAGPESGSEEIKESEITATPEATPLEEAYWKLAELYGEPIPPVMGKREAHIIFHGSDMSVSGSGGCNNFRGAYELFTDCTGTWLNILNPVTTRMACPDMNTEMFFLQAMGETATFETGPDRMSLKDEKGEIIARFEAVWLR